MSARTADWEPAYQALVYAGDRLMQRAEAAKDREARDVTLALLSAAGALYTEAAAVIGQPSLAEAAGGGR